MKISLITKIELLASGKYPNWIPAGEIEIFSQHEGYLATHGGRRARDLVAKEILERVKDGVSVKYRFIPPEQRTKIESPPKIPKRYFNPAEFIGAAERINKIPALEKANVVQNKLF